MFMLAGLFLSTAAIIVNLVPPQAGGESLCRMPMTWGLGIILSAVLLLSVAKWQTTVQFLKLTFKWAFGIGRTAPPALTRVLGFVVNLFTIGTATKLAAGMLCHALTLIRWGECTHVGPA
jgi:hypothetical protein